MRAFDERSGASNECSGFSFNDCSGASRNECSGAFRVSVVVRAFMGGVSSVVSGLRLISLIIICALISIRAFIDIGRRPQSLFS